MEIKLVEWFNEHWYKVKIDGVDQYFPSVTTKLGVVAKPFLAKWRGDIGNREADMRVFEAQERGTRIHHAWWTLTSMGAVVFNAPKHPNYSPEEIEAIKNEHNGLIEIIKYQEEMYQLLKLKKFMDIVKPEIVASETIVYSEKYREAGTIDNVFKIKEGEYMVNGRTPLYLKEGVYIADLKTGSTFDDNAYMQMAAYAKMFEDLNQVKVEGTLGLHTSSTNKTGIPGLGVKAHNWAEVNQDFQDFRNVSALWERQHKDDKPDTFVIPAFISLIKKQETK